MEGEHIVTISKEGYSIFKKVVNITEDDTETISATMEKTIFISNQIPMPIQGKAQIDINEKEASIIVSGRLAYEDWRRLKDLCKTKGIRTVDLTKAQCSSITDYAFEYCWDMDTIMLPPSVTYIGKYAFFQCGIKTITIPDRVNKIEEYTFSGSCLTSVMIPSSVTTIANKAFYRCGSLTSITIPNGVTTIGNSAFSYCHSLTSITITNSLTNIGEGAFYGCSKLTVYVPKGAISRFDKNKIEATRIVEMK